MQKKIKKIAKKATKKATAKKAEVKKVAKKVVKKAAAKKTEVKKVAKKAAAKKTVVTKKPKVASVVNFEAIRKMQADNDYSSIVLASELLKEVQSTDDELEDLFDFLFGDSDKKKDLEEIFAELDLNEDHVLTPNELEAVADPETKKEKITLEELFAGIDLNRDKKITLEELFEYVEGTTEEKESISLEELFAQAEEKIQATPAYSSIITSVDAEESDDASEEDSEEEQAFTYHQEWFRKASFSLGIALLALVVSGMWYQVTRGQFHGIEQSSVQQQKKAPNTFEKAQKNIDSLLEQAR